MSKKPAPFDRRSDSKKDHKKDASHRSGNDDKKSFRKDKEGKPAREKRTNDNADRPKRPTFDRKPFDSKREERPFSKDKDRRFDKRDKFTDRKNKAEDGGTERKERKPFGDRSDRKPERTIRKREDSGDKRFTRRKDEGQEKPERRFDKRDKFADRKSNSEKGAYEKKERKPFARKEEGDIERERGFKKREDKGDRKFSRDRKEGDHKADKRERKPFGDTEGRGKRKEGGFRKNDDRKDRKFTRKRAHDEEEGEIRERMPAFSKELPEVEKTKRSFAPSEEKAIEGAMTLNKYIAHSGECSRRDAAEMVKQGKVRVNGELILEPGYRVEPGDQVTLSGKKLTPQKNLVYILLNKPKGYITTTEDPEERKTVMDLVASAEVDRLYPVGRLDRNTTGVLLLTNDGALAHRLSHPSYNMKKVYQVTLDKNLTRADYEKISKGLELEDGLIQVDEIAYLEDRKEIGIEIHSGKNRIVRRIFESLGYTVEKLDRVMYAGLTKKNVSRGKWRFLTEKEVIFLKHFKG